MDGFGLADAVGAVDGLGFDGGVPPGIEEVDVIGGGEIQSKSAGFERDEEERTLGIGLEALDTLLALATSIGLAAYLFYVLARPERF